MIAATVRLAVAGFVLAAAPAAAEELAMVVG
jgi:hypothetical protein